jgi:phosphomannomutase
MYTAYLFDIDGTLTPSRQCIDPEFKKLMLAFADTHNVYLVTGSDKPKTVEQIGEDLFNRARRVYNCAGNDVWEKGVNVYTNDWALPADAHEWLAQQLTSSAYNVRTGLHFEHRPGCVNFSIVGRNANNEQRADYFAYDEQSGERIWIADKFNLTFPGLQATVGGETGIDIAALGKDKGQIYKDFVDYDDIVFFGDRTAPGGNDYPLAKILIELDHGCVFQVDHWSNTQKILENIQ